MPLSPERFKYASETRKRHVGCVLPLRIAQVLDYFGCESVR
jgi:hypothetical protein